MIKLQLGIRVKKDVVSVERWMKAYHETIIRETFYPIVLMIPPRFDMNDALLIFETESERVRIRLDEERWKALKDEYRIRDRDDIEGRIISFIARKNFAAIDAIPTDDVNEITYRYDRVRGYWKLISKYAYEYTHTYF